MALAFPIHLLCLWELKISLGMVISKPRVRQDMLLRSSPGASTVQQSTRLVVLPPVPPPLPPFAEITPKLNNRNNPRKDNNLLLLLKQFRIMSKRESNVLNLNLILVIAISKCMTCFKFL